MLVGQYPHHLIFCPPVSMVKNATTMIEVYLHACSKINLLVTYCNTRFGTVMYLLRVHCIEGEKLPL